MAGITHSWNGTVLTITSDSGSSSCDLKGATGDTGIRGPQGPKGEKGSAIDSVNGKIGDVVLTYEDVGALPDTYIPPVTKVNNKTGEVTLTYVDVGALPNTYVAPVTSVNTKTGAVQLTYSDVNAAAANHTHTAAEVGAMPNTYVAPVTSVNGLTGDITIDIEGAVSNAYSPTNPPPYPVTSVNGKTGAVSIVAGVSSVNGQTGAVTISTGGGFDLLWTNSNPTAEFAAKEISISNMTNYKLIAILHTTFDKAYSDLTFLVPETDYWCQLVEYTAPALFYKRAVDYFSGKLKFYDAKYTIADAGESSTVNNKYCIPYKIYGVK